MNKLNSYFLFIFISFVVSLSAGAEDKAIMKVSAPEKVTIDLSEHPENELVLETDSVQFLNNAKVTHVTIKLDYFYEAQTKTTRLQSWIRALSQIKERPRVIDRVEIDSYIGWRLTTSEGNQVKVSTDIFGSDVELEFVEFKDGTNIYSYPDWVDSVIYRKLLSLTLEFLRKNHMVNSQGECSRLLLM